MNNVLNSIGWADFSVNPIKGLCPVACPYCYARRAYGRNCNEIFRDKTIRLDLDAMCGKELSKVPGGSRIFVGSTMELFGEWIKPEWSKYIFDMVRMFPKLIFIFLTKRPENLIKFSPFPKNCWVGISATNDTMLTHGVVGLSYIESSVKFISIEPLLNWDMSKIDLTWTLENYHIKWSIVGRQTPASIKTQPNVEWIKSITESASKARVPIFLKQNLRKLMIDLDCTWAFEEDSGLKQQFPKIKGK
jgi:protein gp37